MKLTLSFFPAKVLNPLKTFAQKGSEVDLGEVASILHFYELALAISLLYAPGAQIVFTADGIKYHEVFGFSRDAALGYKANIQSIIDFFGLDDFLKVVEESDLYPDNFQSIVQDCLNQIKKEYKEGVISTVELYDKLYCNTALGLAVAGSMDVHQLASIFSADANPRFEEQADEETIRAHRALKARAHEATFLYMAVYRAGYEVNLCENHFSEVLKATIHPKEGQIGLHALSNSTNNYFPHHGQGCVKLSDIEKGITLDDVRIDFAADILRCNKGDKVKAIVLPSGKYPFADSTHPFAIVES